MNVRQVDIAKACGLDVSSVNKILNGRSGAVFHRDTIRKVKKTARELGWKPSPRSKFISLRELDVAKNRISVLEAENKNLRDQLAAIQKYKSA